MYDFIHPVIELHFHAHEAGCVHLAVAKQPSACTREGYPYIVCRLLHPMRGCLQKIGAACRILVDLILHQVLSPAQHLPASDEMVEKSWGEGLALDSPLVN